MSDSHIADDDRLQRLNALLDVGLALPAAEREHWLADLPAADQDLRDRLAALLTRSAGPDDGFLAQPLHVHERGLPVLATRPDQAGDRIGPYRLVRELGAGGMATVWLADRNDGLLRRQVALKLPREGWALGLAERMASERDILAALDHPHIARLYDAGVTAQGRPWLAIECIEGEPIDVHCQAQGLDVPARLGLLLQVTDAVAHAHARLVVHRDLKPSNILVTADGSVRLLDFGVARLLEGDAAAASHITQLMGRVVTPDYASPEQVAGRAVTVATDIYSMGVVMFEVLTGQRPYHLSRVTPAALEDAVLHAERPLASTRVGSRALARQLRGDIDTILAKALHVDAAQRYSSMEALAADLRRHLQGEPVLARPPSRRYRTLKFVRRRRWPLATAGAVTLSVVSGLAVALWQADAARTEARRAQQARDFLAGVLKQAGPSPDQRGVTLVSDLLLRAGERIDAELSADPAAAAELGVIVGHGLSSLGVPEWGEPTLRRAVQRALQTLGPRHPTTVHGRALWAESLYRSEPRQAAQVAQALVPDALAGLPATAVDAAAAHRSLAIDHADHRRRDEAVAAARQAVAIAEQHLGPDHRESVISLLVLAGVHGSLGMQVQQLDAATRALQRAQRAFGPLRPHETLAKAERAYGTALRRMGRPADAVALLRRAWSDLRLLDADDTSRVIVARFQLGLALADSGQVAEALDQLSDTLAAANRQTFADNDYRSSYTRGLARTMATARRTHEALALLNALPILTSTERQPDLEAAQMDRVERLRLLAYQGQAGSVDDGMQALRSEQPPLPDTLGLRARGVVLLQARLNGRAAQAVDIGTALWTDPARARLAPAQRAELAAELAAAHLDQGDTPQAEALVGQALALFQQAQVAPSPLSATAWITQARLHLAARRPADAERVLQPLVQAWAGAHPGSVWHAEALHWLAVSVARQGRHAEARGLRQSALPMLGRSGLPALRRLAASASP